MSLADINTAAIAGEQHAKVITPEQRQRALTLAQINAEKFTLCSPQQAAIAEVLRMNAELLAEIAL